MQGSFTRLQQAVRWARANGISVMVDLHGAVASQNGWDESGRKGAVGWFDTSDNMRRTLAAIQTFATEFAKPAYGGTVVACVLRVDSSHSWSRIEVVNEPLTNQRSTSATRLSFLSSYMAQAFAIIHSPGLPFAFTCVPTGPRRTLTAQIPRRIPVSRILVQVHAVEDLEGRRVRVRGCDPSDRPGSPITSTAPSRLRACA